MKPTYKLKTFDIARKFVNGNVMYIIVVILFPQSGDSYTVYPLDGFHHTTFDAARRVLTEGLQDLYETWRDLEMRLENMAVVGALDYEAICTPNNNTVTRWFISGEEKDIPIE